MDQMGWEYIGKLLLSILIFAPGLILLTMAVLIGFLMALEKLGVFRARKRIGETITEAEAQAAQATNPAPGRIVAELKESVEGAEDEEEKRGRTAS